MTKTEVFKLGAAMGVRYDLTWSCSRAGRLHCGQCTACRARRRAFADAGLVDPTRYEAAYCVGILSAPAASIGIAIELQAVAAGLAGKFCSAKRLKVSLIASPPLAWSML